MKSIAFLFLAAGAAAAQTTEVGIAAILARPVQEPAITAAALRRHLAALVPRLRVPADAASWTAEAARLRRQVLQDVVYHGWPREWVDSPPAFTDLGEIRAGRGYRLRKFRYEIVRGFQSTALLYEPAAAAGRVAAILNVNGHEAEGKSTEYIQKRCINQARQGILALNLEWIGMGELALPHNAHWFEAHLDMAGANGLGLFYLAMRRGLDFLWDDPRVDRSRIGITGLSGGGWQTIVLSALDERILAALPNAGYLSNLSIGGAENVGDNEQSATDFGAAVDYPHLTAMRAPKPTLLIFNETDNCCFRAPRMKPFLYDPVRPIFALFGAADRLGWYENTDPGDHNYQLDNRMHSYEFFARSFGMPRVKEESPATADIKTAAELNGGLPENNLTIVRLAQRFASEIRRSPAGNHAEEIERLRRIVRYHDAALRNAWPVANSFGHGIKTVSWRFDFDNGLSANAVHFSPVAERETGAWTLAIGDSGKKASAALVSDRINRGEQVLAADLLFYGDAAPPPLYYPMYDRAMATLGERSLGIEAAQLLAIARWLRDEKGARRVRLVANGMRTQAVALAASALAPGVFSELDVRGGLESWSTVFEKPVSYQDAPELFCLDLYRYFDIPRVAALTTGTSAKAARPADRESSR